MIGRVFYSLGEDQKTLRSFVIHGLHEFQKTFLPTRVSEEARHLCIAFEKKQSQPFDPTEYLSLAASNIMALVNFGQRFVYVTENEIVQGYRGKKLKCFASLPAVWPHMCCRSIVRREGWMF